MDATVNPSARTVETDVLVVGGGGSGLAAAIEAARAGRQVVLIEKNPQTGGSTGWSVGSITATRTPDQQRKGIVDDPQHHFEDMAKLAGALLPRDNLALRHTLVHNVTDTLAWLRSLGVEFFGPGAEPPHRLPRMHNVLPTSGSYVWHLTRAARRAGVDIHLSTRASRIVLDGDTVCGIEARDAHDRPVLYTARHGVVLAGGDYSGSVDFKTRYGSAALARVPAVNTTNTGDCQRMVLEIGGEVLNGDLILGPVMRFAPPPRKGLAQRVPPWAPITRTMAWMLHHLPSTIVRSLVMRFMTTVLGPEAALFADGVLLVDRNGERIQPIEGSLGKAVAAAPERSAWLIFDDRQAERYSAPPHAVSTAPGIAWAYFGDYVRTRPDLCTKAGDATALAKQLDMPPAALLASLNNSREPRMGPFHALGPIHSYVVLTDGGVRVTPELQVVVRGSIPVRGLYAAGSTGQGGLLLEGHGHHLGWAFTSGRIAGRHAAAATTTILSSTTLP
ncbi:FAD-dependent oxidoreductase [Variovorax sp. PBL-E5]|uniref:FAD-dependent oxidoreductase n=1 Tax=Variovorax sp. PBL-E5 TaxID=434014 RepID=UPI0013165334|nr:FAD-dependent oxidoreductase [Variovorax sp. PBL-E5]VTU30849.1 Fumarate reductase flavoprotein subunit precursor [Variovorax sp. PBL-E5]